MQLEIIKTIFCLIGHWSAPFTRGHTGMASFRQGRTWLSWISFQNLEGSVGSGYCYSCLSQKCVLVLRLFFKIKYSSSYHALPAPPSQANPCCTKFLFSFWQCIFYLFVISESLTLHLSCKWQVCSQKNSDKFLIAHGAAVRPLPV